MAAVLKTADSNQTAREWWRTLVRESFGAVRAAHGATTIDEHLTWQSDGERVQISAGVETLLASAEWRVVLRAEPLTIAFYGEMTAAARFALEEVSAIVEREYERRDRAEPPAVAGDPALPIGVVLRPGVDVRPSGNGGYAVFDGDQFVGRVALIDATWLSTATLTNYGSMADAVESLFEKGGANPE